MPPSEFVSYEMIKWHLEFVQKYFVASCRAAQLKLILKVPRLADAATSKAAVRPCFILNL